MSEKNVAMLFNCICRISIRPSHLVGGKIAVLGGLVLIGIGLRIVLEHLA
jgi:putative Mn2+ efflux pump MntP